MKLTPEEIDTINSIPLERNESDEPYKLITYVENGCTKVHYSYSKADYERFLASLRLRGGELVK